METKIKNILDTLQECQCPYAGDGKDKWLTEILFKSSFERYKLIEWILEQLGINFSEMSQSENSVESKIQNLTAALSAIGVCDADDLAIVEGTASIKEQLTFWNFLCVMLTKRNYLGNLSFEATDSSDSDSEIVISKHYEQSAEYISKVCETVNLNDCFDKKLQLFPAHLTKEVKEFLKKSHDQEVQCFPDDLSNDLKQESCGSLSAEEIRKNYYDKFGVPELDADINSYMDVQQKDIEFKEFENQVIPEEAALNEAEDKLAVSLKNLENSANTFENVHNNLKPFLLEVKHEEFTDIGPAFKATDDKLNSLLELKNSASSLKSLDSELEILKSEVSGLNISSGCLSDDKLGEYLGILSQEEQKE